MDATDRPLPLQPDTVDLWYCADLGATGTEAALARCLTEPERARAARFARPVDRFRFIARHGLLRQLLGGLTGDAPETVPLGAGANGKPVHLAASPIAFNATSSGAAALVAVASHGSLGIDLERIRRIPDAMRLARQFFAPAEIAALERTAPADFDRAFLRCWTCKEAMVKAWGQGLSVDLNRFEIDFDAASEPRLLHLDGKRADWFLASVDPDSAHRAALATDLEVKRIRHFVWQRDTMVQYRN